MQWDSQQLPCGGGERAEVDSFLAQSVRDLFVGELRQGESPIYLDTLEPRVIVQIEDPAGEKTRTFGIERSLATVPSTMLRAF